MSDQDISIRLGERVALRTAEKAWAFVPDPRFGRANSGRLLHLRPGATGRISGIDAPAPRRHLAYWVRLDAERVEVRLWPRQLERLPDAAKGATG